MDQKIDQPIEVMVVFKKRRMIPVRFKWNGRVVRIAKLTGWWKSYEGEFKIRHFGVMDQDGQFYQVSYRERTTEWFLEKIWVK